MKTRVAFSLLILLGLAFGAENILAQQNPAEGDKTNQAAQDKAKNPWGYSVTSSVEVGVRGVSVNGDADKFRSDLNYEPGVRLFNSSLLMQSKNNDGLLFDTLLINSFGWGGDPNQYVRVNAEKTKVYRFDGNYRRIDYFNSLRNFALNQHISNTQYQVGDFNVTLLPANERIRFNLGYALDRNKGDAVTTYDYSRDEFPILAPTRYEANDYRFGVDAKVSIIDISFLQGFRYFKEDTTYLVDTPQPGNTPTNFSEIDTFQRDMPVRGRVPYSRLSVHSLIKNRVDVTGRILYSSATTNFHFNERLSGTDVSNNKILLDQFIANGDTKRPSTLGDLGVTVFATRKLRLSDTLRVYTFQINGGRALSEALFRTRPTPFGDSPLPVLLLDELAFNVTSYRRYQNTVEGDYEFNSRLALHFGYRYSNRHIEQESLTEIPDALPGEPEEPEIFDNTAHAGFVGFKARPLKVWSLYFDLEKGTTDNVFTRVDNYNYTNVRLRSIIKPVKTLAINTSLVTKDNNNPTLTPEFPFRDFGVDINSRIYTGSVDWTPNEKFFLSSGYTYTRLTSQAQVIFFSNFQQLDGLSRYFFRDHFGFINTSIQLHPRATLFAGYFISKDNGAGDRKPVSAAELIGSYPLQFQSPEFRLSIRLTKNIDWIAGYRWYDYKEDFPNLQKYNAHLPYMSVKISFDRGKGE